MYAKVPRLLGTDYKADEGVEDAYLKSVYGVGVKIMARAQKDKSAPDKMLLQDLQKQLEQELANIDAGHNSFFTNQILCLQTNLLSI